MPVYRLHWVGDDDHFKLAQDIKCASDEEALARAETMISQYAAMEVWDAARFVRRVEAPPPPPQAA